MKNKINIKHMLLTCVTLGLLGVTSVSHAQNLVQNPSIEVSSDWTQVVYNGPGTVITTPPRSYTAFADTLLREEIPESESLGNGDNFALILGTRANAQSQFLGASVTQDVSGLVIGNTYEFSFMLGNGEQLNAIDPVNGAIVDGFFGGTAVGASVTEGEVGVYSFNVVATSTTETIGFGLTQFDNNQVDSVYFIFDDVSLVQVPEPSATLIGMMGLFGLAFRRSRK